MNREKQITDALIELSQTGQAVNLDLIELIVRRNTTGALPPTWKDMARHVLRTLSGLGLVEVGGSDKSRLSYGTVKLTHAFLATPLVQSAARKHAADLASQRRQKSEMDDDPTPPRGSGSAGGGRGDGGGDGEEPVDGGGGGDGFREVLAHPFLFSLSKSDFNQLLNEI